MSKDFLPASDAALLVWSARFSSWISSTPLVVGLTPVQAASYATLHGVYESAQIAAADPATRTRATISTRDDKRTPLKASARELARIINAFPATTNAQRLDLGLNPRTGTVAPVPVPDEPPILEVVRAIGRTLKLRLHGTDTTRRGKPEHVSGASVFSFVGSAPPADISLWKFEGSSTRTLFSVEFPATVPAGSQVFLTAFWFNPRSQSGPACTPVSAYLAGGVSSSLEQLKEAA